VQADHGLQCFSSSPTIAPVSCHDCLSLIIFGADWPEKRGDLLDLFRVKAPLAAFHAKKPTFWQHGAQKAGCLDNKAACLDKSPSVLTKARTQKAGFRQIQADPLRTSPRRAEIQKNARPCAGRHCT
jgi:hypothetical protein